MGNIFKDYTVGIRYDLKGSTQGRTFLKESQSPRDRKDLKTALKDNDFIKHVKNIKIATSVDNRSNESRLEAEQNNLASTCNSMIDILKEDANFLS